MRVVFLAAFACSGLAGLMYQVVWIRLFSLHLGHTTAATSAVVASVMSGLALGAVIGGRLSAAWTARQAGLAYAASEVGAAALSVLVPMVLPSTTPVLRWAYGDGDPSVWFLAARVALCAALLVPIATLLGATLPFAARWSRGASTGPSPVASAPGAALYAANTVGAAGGAVAAGFFLLPILGLRATTWVAALGSVIAALVALVLVRSKSVAGSADVAGSGREWVGGAGDPRTGVPARRATRKPAAALPARTRGVAVASRPLDDVPWMVPVTTLALTGFATCLLEIVWSRVFAMVFGPSTYAFAAVVAVFIAALAVGSVAGSAWLRGQTRPTTPLALSLGLGACATVWAATRAGTVLPREAILTFSSLASYQDLLTACLGWTAVLVGPAALCMGLAFPLTLRLADRPGAATERRLGALYAVNTLASVAGALIGGFLAIPRAGLEISLLAAALALAAAAVLVGSREPVGRRRVIGAIPLAAALAVMLAAPPWNRALLSAGGYKYASVTSDRDAEAVLTAGSLLYYREGSAGTVSVRDLGGVRSLAIDGKVDASTGADMLTQKLLAHLPLLLHPEPRNVAVVGLGSGVTLASALSHPVLSAEAIEISPQVVEAAQWFEAQNGSALQDPRARLIVGDARSHVLLGSKPYDVVISEPSNPWMAGVAALFTQEFLQGVRRRLAPQGILCQWIHTYDIADPDVRSVVATFLNVFPNATLWMVGDGDVLLIGSVTDEPLPFDRIERGITRARVASDLAGVGVESAFEIHSLYAAGPAALARYGSGAAIQRDDRLSLEFSGPYALFGNGGPDVRAAVHALASDGERPAVIGRALNGARADNWRARGDMLMSAQAPAAAYESFARALALDPSDGSALEGLVKSSTAAGRTDDALAWLRRTTRPESAVARLVASSKILLARGAVTEAVAAAEAAANHVPMTPDGVEQLAAIYADLGDGPRLEAAVSWLCRFFPTRPAVPYYRAAAAFLRGDLAAATDWARRAVEADPSRAAVQNLLGAALARAGRFDEARATLEAAKRLEPHDSTIYVNLAGVELDSGQAPAAAAAFAEALALDPGSQAARRGLEATNAGR